MPGLHGIAPASLFQHAWTMQRGVQRDRASRSLQARFFWGPENGAPAREWAHFFDFWGSGSSKNGAPAREWAQFLIFDIFC